MSTRTGTYTEWSTGYVRTYLCTCTGRYRACTVQVVDVGELLQLCPRSRSRLTVYCTFCSQYFDFDDDDSASGTGGAGASGMDGGQHQSKRPGRGWSASAPVLFTLSKGSPLLRNRFDNHWHHYRHLRRDVVCTITYVPFSAV